MLNGRKEGILSTISLLRTPRREEGELWTRTFLLLILPSLHPSIQQSHRAEAATATDLLRRSLVVIVVRWSFRSTQPPHRSDKNRLTQHLVEPEQLPLPSDLTRTKLAARCYITLPATRPPTPPPLPPLPPPPSPQPPTAAAHQHRNLFRSFQLRSSLL